MHRRQTFVRPWISNHSLMPMLASLLVFLSAVAVGPRPSCAQNGIRPQPNLLAIYPAGGQVGKSFTARITEQYQLEEAHGLWVLHSGIKATPIMRPADAFYPEARRKTNEFEIRIAPNTPPGVYEVRAISRYGLTNARRFEVGELAELLEEEGNNDRESANETKVNQTINGMFGADYDYFRFQARRDERLTISCQAWRLDSRGDAVLTLYDSQGKQLDRVHDTAGSDPVLDFRPPADGEYFVCVNDLTYTASGGRETSPYRLSIHQRPWIDFVEPALIAGNQRSKVQIYGRNLGGALSERRINGRRLEMIELEVDPKSLATANPLAMNCAPVEASIDFRMIEFATSHGKSNPAFVAISSQALQDEAEPNEKIEQAKPLPLPISVRGRFDRPGDIDGYAFEAKKGESLWIEVKSQRLRQGTDPSFVIQQMTQDKEGEWRLRDRAPANDLPSPLGNFRLPLASDDPATLFAVPEDGRYRVLLRDDFGGGSDGATQCYHLSIRKPTPSFRAVTVAGLSLSSNNSNNRPLKPGCCIVAPGAAVEVVVAVYRSEGFEGEVSVALESIPPGLECEPIRMSGTQTMGAVLIRAKKDAKPWSGPIHLVASATVDGKTEKQKAANVELLWDSPRDNRSTNACRLTQPILLSIDDGLPTAGHLSLSTKSFETARGSKIKVPLTFHKEMDSANGSLSVSAVNPPNRVTARAVAVAAGKAGNIELDLLQDVKPGKYTLFLRGDAEYDFEREKELLDRAMADQKRIQDVVNKANQAYRTAQSAKRSRDQEYQRANSTWTQRNSERQRAASAEKLALGVLTKAKQTQAKSPSDSSKQALSSAETKHKAAAESLKKVETALADAKSKLETLKKQQQEAITAEADAKKHYDQANVEKRSIDQFVSRARSMARKSKIKSPVHSELLTLHVHAMPFTYVDPMESVALTAGDSKEFEFRIQRLFDFKGDVEIQLRSPVGSRLRLEKTTRITGGKQSVQAKIMVDKSLAESEYECQFVVRTRNNNRSLDETLPLKIVVSSKP